MNKQFCTENISEFAKQIAAIEAVAFPNDAWSTDSLIDLLAQDINKVIVIWDDENPKHLKGYCIYQALFDNAEILRIASHPVNQRQGVGSQLLAKLITELTAVSNPITQVMLEVRADNQAAINLYHKYGFKHIHTRRGYYKTSNATNCDALIMQLELANEYE